MLNRSTFDREYERMYAVFGGRAPNDRRREVVWDSVQDTDDAFFCNAVDKICEGSQQPKNLVAEFGRLWDVWVAGRTVYRSDDPGAPAPCPEGCENGWLMVYRTDRPLAPFAFKCRCNLDKRFADMRAYTRAELEQRPEFSFEDPFRTREQRNAWLAERDARTAQEQGAQAVAAPQKDMPRRIQPMQAFGGAGYDAKPF